MMRFEHANVQEKIDSGIDNVYYTVFSNMQ